MLDRLPCLTEVESHSETGQGELGWHRYCTCPPCQSSMEVQGICVNGPEGSGRDEQSPTWGFLPDQVRASLKMQTRLCTLFAFVGNWCQCAQNMLEVKSNIPLRYVYHASSTHSAELVRGVAPIVRL